MYSGNKLKSTSGNQSTEKALQIIELLSDAEEPMRLLDISHALGMNTSTTLRFLNTLQKFGYVSQNNADQRYKMTLKICRVANHVSAHVQLASITHPYLLALSTEFQEALSVSIEQDMQMVYIDVVAASEQRLMSLQCLGGQSPMHCTGNGKTLLLNYSTEQIDHLISEKGLPRFTENTIVTKEALLAELEQIHKDGIAHDREECELGIRCIACPIRDYTGIIIAGISVTGPTVRMTDGKIAIIRGRLSETAEKISKELGYQP